MCDRVFADKETTMNQETTITEELTARIDYERAKRGLPQFKGENNNNPDSYRAIQLDPSEVVNNSLVKERLAMILLKLTARQRFVIECRFGLVDGNTNSLREVGRRLGVCGQRIRGLETQALRRIRSYHGKDIEELYVSIQK